MPTEIAINGTEYRTGVLTAKQQFHIARRLMPVIAKVGAAQQPRINGDGEEDSSPVFEAIADSISMLSDTDCDYVIGRCMATVMRKQGDNWVNAWNRQSDTPQFGDIDLAALLQLTFAVIQDQLGGFMSGQSLTGQALMNPTSP